jgi:hypothetical protein
MTRILGMECLSDNGSYINCGALLSYLLHCSVLNIVPVRTALLASGFQFPDAYGSQQRWIAAAAVLRQERTLSLCLFF